MPVCHFSSLLFLFIALANVVAGMDYTDTSTMLMFTSVTGTTPQCVTVPIIDDTTTEGDQMFIINYVVNDAMTNLTEAGTTAMISPSSTTVTIQDNDGQLLCTCNFNPLSAPLSPCSHHCELCSRHVLCD